MGFSLSVPQVGQPNATEAPKIATDFTTLQSWGNGNIDAPDIKATVAQSAGVNQSGQTVKGSAVIATSQSTGSTSYTTLATPDQVSGIVLPTNGLIVVWYQAVWQESVSGAGKAAIFLGANQLRYGVAGGSGPSVSEASNGAAGVANVSNVLASSWRGLDSQNGRGISQVSYSGDATTGQVVGGGWDGSTADFSASVVTGGPCNIFAAAGTYTVSVQFKTSSGTVTAANRRLYVKAVSFA